MILGPHYHRSDYIPVTDMLRPGIAYEQATKLAEKLDGGDKRRDDDKSLRATVRRSYNDAGEVIGYTVRSRHWIGPVGVDHPDKQKDRPGDAHN